MAGPKPEFIPIDLRNLGKGEVNPDETATPSSVLIDIHYAKLGIQSVWTKARVLRLCGWLRISRYELASLLMLPHRQMDKCMEKDLFPGPVALLLTIFENSFAAGVLMDAVVEKPGDPIIPSHLIHDGPSEET